MRQIFGTGESEFELQPYADMFSKNHITGRRLLLLSEEDMRELGMTSKGHIIHLKTEIKNLTHDYLERFHFPPLMKNDWIGEIEEPFQKVINLELVFGYHWRAGSGPKDCKWKMYMELDGDEVAVTYIKDVTFNANRPDVGVLKMNKPPFLMDKWVVGISDGQTVDCIINYENDVQSPKSTRHTHVVQIGSGNDYITTVQLVIEAPLSIVEGKFRSRSNSGVDQEWISCLKWKQEHGQISQPSPNHSADMTLPQFLSAYGNQSSYAAAVRRSPNHSPFTPWTHSRCSSPTAGLSVKLSSLYLGSKGSSPSSTTSESPSERERPQSAGATYNYQRNRSHGNTPYASRGGARRASIGACPAHVPRPARNTRGAHHGGRARISSHSAVPPNPTRTIPGMSVADEENQGASGEAKVSEGGWIKVERQKRPVKPDQKQVRGRPRRGGGRGGRGRN